MTGQSPDEQEQTCGRCGRESVNVRRRLNMQAIPLCRRCFEDRREDTERKHA